MLSYSVYTYILTPVIMSAPDGDNLVDFYWIDLLLNAERIVAKSKYAGKLYL